MSFALLDNHPFQNYGRAARSSLSALSTAAVAAVWTPAARPPLASDRSRQPFSGAVDKGSIDHKTAPAGPLAPALRSRSPSTKLAEPVALAGLGA
jgi:hypothetical protein